MWVAGDDDDDCGACVWEADCCVVGAGVGGSAVGVVEVCGCVVDVVAVSV